MLWFIRWTTPSVAQTVWRTTTSVSYRWRHVAVRRSYSSSHLDRAVSTLQYSLSSIYPTPLSHLVLTVECFWVTWLMSDTWLNIIEVTHAQKTCTRNLHGIESSSIWWKFLAVAWQQKHSRPIKPHNFGHMHQCKFLQYLAMSMSMSIVRCLAWLK